MDSVEDEDNASSELAIYSQFSKDDEQEGIVDDAIQPIKETKKVDMQLKENFDRILEKDFRELYSCDKCNRQFKQKSRYDRHMANHPSEKSYLCSTCQKTFTRMVYLDKHMRTHTDERRHVCNVCGAAFILPHHLVRHNLLHTGVRPFACDVCDKKFTRKAGLTQHQLVHTGVRPFRCAFDDCGKQFRDRTTLRRHCLTHSSEKPFICKECEKTFRTKSACRKHYVRHFDPSESFKCGICEEMFKTEPLLNQHMNTHDSKRPNKNFRCGFCMRVFKSQADLDSHIPQHDSGLVFNCSFCPAKFYTKNDLNNHSLQHHGGEVCSVVEKTSNNEMVNKKGTAACNNKTMVVLQLPTSADVVGGVKQNQQDDVQISDLHLLLDNARLEKLLVTTSNSITPSLEFQLSRDQQEGLNEILQSANMGNLQYLQAQSENSEKDDTVNGADFIPQFTDNAVQPTNLLSVKFPEKVKSNPEYIILQSTADSPCESSISNYDKEHKTTGCVYKSNDLPVNADMLFVSNNSAELNNMASDHLSKPRFISPFDDIDIGETRGALDLGNGGIGESSEMLLEPPLG